MSLNETKRNSSWSQIPLFSANGLQMVLAALSRASKWFEKSPKFEISRLGAKVISIKIWVPSSFSHSFLSFLDWFATSLCNISQHFQTNLKDLQKFEVTHRGDWCWNLGIFKLLSEIPLFFSNGLQMVLSVLPL